MERQIKSVSGWTDRTRRYGFHSVLLALLHGAGMPTCPSVFADGLRQRSQLRRPGERAVVQKPLEFFGIHGRQILEQPGYRACSRFRGPLVNAMDMAEITDVCTSRQKSLRLEPLGQRPQSRNLFAIDIHFRHIFRRLDPHPRAVRYRNADRAVRSHWSLRGYRIVLLPEMRRAKPRTTFPALPHTRASQLEKATEGPGQSASAGLLEAKGASLEASGG